MNALGVSPGRHTEIIMLPFSKYILCGDLYSYRSVENIFWALLALKVEGLVGPFSGCLPGDGQHWRSVGRPLDDELVEQVARVGFRPVRGSVRPDSEPFQQISLSATGYGYGGPVLHHEAGRITAQHPLDVAHVHQVAVVCPEEAHALHQALHVLQRLGDQ